MGNLAVASYLSPTGLSCPREQFFSPSSGVPLDLDQIIDCLLSIYIAIICILRLSPSRLLSPQVVLVTKVNDKWLLKKVEMELFFITTVWRQFTLI